MSNQQITTKNFDVASLNMDQAHSLLSVLSCYHENSASSLPEDYLNDVVCLARDIVDTARKALVPI